MQENITNKDAVRTLNGLIETAGADGRHLGIEAIVACLAAHGGEGLGQVHDAVMALVRGHGVQVDDQSLVLVRVGSGAAG